MIGALFVMTGKGDVVISRMFRDDIGRGFAEAFRFHVVGSTDVRSPILTVGSTTFSHILVGTLYVVAVTRVNANVAIVFEMLHKLVAIFKSYFNNKFEEETIRSNFVLIYELLDEIMDYGYPQTTDAEVLKMYITQESNISKVNVLEAISTLTGQTPWRPLGIKYQQNELFIDVIEQVNVLMSAKGTISRADVTGKIMLKCCLSGMPECTFGINDKLLLEKEALKQRQQRRRPGGIEIDDCNFHQCVRLGKFGVERTIVFVPPDGDFELMNYRITDNISLPFKLIPMVKEIGRTQVEIKLTIKSCFGADMVGTGVSIKIPTPKNTAICDIKTAIGSAKYQPAHEAIVWRIKSFPGGTEWTLSANVTLALGVLGKSTWSRPPISIQFSVPMFTTSGLHVRFLRVVESKLRYQTVKWVRYVTKAGQYQFRI
eukprot:TRINITY_DN2312_c0_g1_i1.p1 TRINITY_DN2312_c0_g1~~TRINITY_DN2312_c0_g1_i1.p1  ORF type:complete len:429 (-),score=162.35 TRINITY_DN2312_c0_g1_i1:78-1364(-)